ncbi:hypothetical protein [Magnetofaba australis]|uniref:Putative lipopolysaccharide biosynthesis protein n=1 Tax=Magnetofaba australis IT-1 TaxID=1434232 RepID=A0A1Y2K6L7_9PROT|nr:hypothetical protein [Magnetofaba australis]OSM05304.1 putative lipopolysaccharide biosynthesis protein [Magnetofaba australis IT-1]
MSFLKKMITPPKPLHQQAMSDRMNTLAPQTPPPPQQANAPMSAMPSAQQGPMLPLVVNLPPEEDVDVLGIVFGILRFWPFMVICAVVGGYNAYQKENKLPRVYQAQVSYYLQAGGATGNTGGGLLGAVLGGGGGGDDPMMSGSAGKAQVLLNSRTYLQDLVKRRNLLPDLFPERWDPVNETWKGGPENAPTVEEGAAKFRGRVRLSAGLPGVGLLSVTWYDREVAARWANMMVEELNYSLRTKKINDSERRVKYLLKLIETIPYVELQQSMMKMYETEIKDTIMLRTKPDFAFEVIDPALVPPEGSHISPRPDAKMKTGAVGGLSVGVILAVASHFLLVGVSGWWRRRKELQAAAKGGADATKSGKQAEGETGSETPASAQGQTSGGDHSTGAPTKD